MDFLTKLQQQAFQNIDIHNDVNIISGFMVEQFPILFQEAISYYNSNEDIIIIEVGSFMGLSAKTMADILKNINMNNSKIICVDTWLGSPEHIENIQRNNEAIPSLYKIFLQNIKSSNNHDIIYPFAISSAQAAHYFLQNNILANIIYIDAGHEYEAVKLDIELYWKLVKPGGFMIFDDYHWPGGNGVKKAVDEFLAYESNKIYNVTFYNSQVVAKKALPGQTYIVIEAAPEKHTQAIIKHYIPELYNHSMFIGKFGEYTFTIN